MREPRERITSLQAAAMILSNGATDDVEQAEMMNAGLELDPDALQRSYFRRILGFDVEVKFAPNYAHIYAKDGTKLSTRAKIYEGDVDSQGNVLGDDVSERMAQAVVRLKKKHDSWLKKQQ